MTGHPSDGVALLRHVDGISHVVLGPPLIMASAPLARLTGAPTHTIVGVLVPFIVYGCAVVVATRDPSVTPPRWLMPVSVAANLSAVAVGAAAAARPELTPRGRLSGVGLAAGGVRMLSALRCRQ